MVDGERNVGVAGLADGFAVIDGFGQRENLEVFLQLVGNLEQYLGSGRG